jgi:hypothetical protein
MGKNKNKAKQEDQPEQAPKEMSFEVVEDEPQENQDDEWIVPGKQGQAKVEHKPVTRADTKKAQPVVQFDTEEAGTADDAKKSKNQAKKEKKAEKEAQEKKAQEEAAKTSNKKKKDEPKKDSPAPATKAKTAPEAKESPKKNKEKESPKKKVEEPKVIDLYSETRN